MSRESRRFGREISTQNNGATQSFPSIPRRGDIQTHGESDNEAEFESANTQGIPQADIQLMVKNFVRLALASEHTRTPIRREEISKKVFVNDHKRCFKLIYDRTQLRLQHTFGMKLVELPAKDRTKNMTMTQQRRNAHHQASANPTTSNYKANRSWILQNILPPELKQISQRQHMESERNYNAVVMIILIIVVMSDDQTCTENRVISILERLSWTPQTSAGPFDEVITKMTRQAYVERVKDDQSVDGSYNLFVGPRGKMETLWNREDLLSLIVTIYGDTSEEAQERMKTLIDSTFDEDEMDVDDEEGDIPGETQFTQTQTQAENEQRSKRKKQRKSAVRADDDDD